MRRCRLLLLALVTAACTGQGAATSPAPPGSAAHPDAEVTEHSRTVPPLHPSVDGYPAAHVELVSPDGATVHRLAVRVADTPDRRTHGLMEVPAVPAGTGMLFVFEEPRSGGFWMKDTLVPLSIAFAGADGRILAIMDMDPCTSDPCPVYDPNVTYLHALEVQRGWFDRVGVEPGWWLEPGAGASTPRAPGAAAAARQEPTPVAPVRTVAA